MCYSVLLISQLFGVSITLQGTIFFPSGTPWLKENIECFWWVCRSLVRETGEGYPKFCCFLDPNSIASHAQKYFISQTNSSRRKRRSSLFDMVPEMVCCFLSCYNFILRMAYFHYALPFLISMLTSSICSQWRSPQLLWNNLLSKIFKVKLETTTT